MVAGASHYRPALPVVPVVLVLVLLLVLALALALVLVRPFLRVYERNFR